jgi:hypothetical protein
MLTFHTHFPFATATILSDTSPEHSDIVHRLKIALPALKEVRCAEGSPRVWAIASSENIRSFLTRTEGISTVDCWLKVSDLGAGNSPLELNGRGGEFRFPAKGGLTFPVGVLHEELEMSDPSANASNHVGQAEPSCSYLMCKVAVGRSYWVDENGKQSVLRNAFKLPIEYDSFCVTKPLPTADTPTNPNDYHYEYVITDETLVLACFVAEVVATEKIDQSAVAMGAHDLDHLQFFDTSLGVPVSIRDQMVGGHAQQDPNSIVSFKQLHQATSASVRHMLAARQSERKRIKQQLLALNQKMDVVHTLRSHTRTRMHTCTHTLSLSLSRGAPHAPHHLLRQVHRSYAAVESKIYNMLGENLSRLHEQKTCWEQLLQSDVVPLWANIGHVDRSQNLLTLARASLTPLQFFQFFEGRSVAAGGAGQAAVGTPAATTPLPFEVFPPLNPGLRIGIRGMISIESPMPLQTAEEQSKPLRAVASAAAAVQVASAGLVSGEVRPLYGGAGPATEGVDSRGEQALVLGSDVLGSDMSVSVDWAAEEDEVGGVLQMHDKVDAKWKQVEVKLKLRSGVIEWFDGATQEKEGELQIVDCSIVSMAHREENPRADHFSLVLEGEKLHFRSEGGHGRSKEGDATYWFDAIEYSICHMRKEMRRTKGLLCAYR